MQTSGDSLEHDNRPQPPNEHAGQRTCGAPCHQQPPFLSSTSFRPCPCAQKQGKKKRTRTSAQMQHNRVAQQKYRERKKAEQTNAQLDKALQEIAQLRVSASKQVRHCQSWNTTNQCLGCG